MSYLDPEILHTLLDRIKESRSDLGKAEEKLEDVIAAHDSIRDTAYHEWKDSDFKEEDLKTWPLVLQNPSAVFDMLDDLNQGVGYLHELVITHRYPELHQQETIVPPQPIMPLQGGSQVVVQSPPVQITREDISRVRSFWTGWHERALEGRRLQHVERMAELEAVEKRKTPDITTAKVQKDPVEAHNELLAAVNATKTFISDCYLCFEGNHRNKFYATLVHVNFRSRVSRLLGAIESYVYAAKDLEIKEIRNTLNQQMHLFTRILEAQAQQEVTIQEIHRPYSEDGFSSKDLEPKKSKRTSMPLEQPSEEEKEPGQQIIEVVPDSNELQITHPTQNEEELEEEEI